MYPLQYPRELDAETDKIEFFPLSKARARGFSITLRLSLFAHIVEWIGPSLCSSLPGREIFFLSRPSPQFVRLFSRATVIEVRRSKLSCRPLFQLAL